MNVIEHDSQSPRLLIDGGKKYPSVVPVLPTALHDHPFAEVHIITQGYALYTVDGITHTVSQGGAILIPKSKYHAVDISQTDEEDAFRIVFHVDTDTENLSILSFPLALITALADDLQSGVDTPSIYHRLFFLVSELIGKNEFSSPPFLDHELMIREAEAAAAEFGVQFLHRDFRPWFREGQDKARELGLYMQKYCGCVFSEEDRYKKRKKKPRKEAQNA